MAWHFLLKLSIRVLIALMLWVLLIFQVRFVVPATVITLDAYGIEPPRPIRIHDIQFAIWNIYALGIATAVVGVVVKGKWLCNLFLIYVPFTLNVIVHVVIFSAQSKLVYVLMAAKMWLRNG